MKKAQREAFREDEKERRRAKGSGSGDGPIGELAGLGETWTPLLKEFTVEGWRPDYAPYSADYPFTPEVWLEDVCRRLLDEMVVLRKAIEMPRRTDDGAGEWDPEKESEENKRLRSALAWLVPPAKRFAVDLVGVPKEDWPCSYSEVKQGDGSELELNRRASLLVTDSWPEEFFGKVNQWLAVGVNAVLYAHANRDWEGGRGGARRKLKKSVWQMQRLREVPELVKERWAKLADDALGESS